MEVYFMNKFIFLLFALLSVIHIASSQWLQQSSPVSVHLQGICFTSPTNGWITGRNGTILHTTNGGVNWLVHSSPSTDNLNKIVFVDSLQGFIVGDGNTILTTSDGGETWQEIYDGNSSYANYYGITLSKNHSKGWIIGGWYTASSFSVLGMHLGYTAPQMFDYLGRGVGVDFIDEQVGWACGDKWWILKTINGGKTWSQQTSGMSGGAWGFSDIKFFNSEIGIAVGDSGVIQRTVNGGTTWSNIRKKDEFFFWADIHNDSTAYVVGQKGTVLVTSDQGETWSSQYTPVSSSITLAQVFFIDANEGWIVGSSGTILHTVNGGVTDVESDNNELPTSFSLKPNYPNPFNPSTTFGYEVPRASYISMKIYDVTGREVETLFEDMKEPGKYEIVWNADRFATGVYYCRLSAKGEGINYAVQQKIVLIK
jgi:photosystem II stability/assembly factor-like uncharacterized protein